MRASTWASALAVAYAAFAALQASDGRGPAWAVLVIGPLAVLAAARQLTPRDVGTGPTARAYGAARVVLTGSAIAAAGLASRGEATRTTCLAVAAALASPAALIALRSLPSEGGLLGPPAGPRAGGAAPLVFLVVAHGASLAARAAVHLDLALALDRADAVVTGAALFGGALCVATAAGALWGRRLELGVPERAVAALQLSSIALLAGLGAAAAGVVPPVVGLTLAAVAGALATAGAAITREATTVRTGSRVAAALLLASVPTALAAGFLARVEPRWAGVSALGATLLAAAAGLAAPTLGRLLAPARTRRVEAVAAAGAAALHPDPEQAVERALVCLRDRGGPRLAEAALYRVAPAAVTRVDRAGFVSTEPTEIPAALIAIAEGEPLGIARTEALRAAEVRRPDVRSLRAWLEDRRIDAVVVVPDETGTAALLGVPPAPGAPAMDLEEVQLLRSLADRLGAAIAAGAALARAREREGVAHRKASEAEAERSTLAEQLDRGAKHLQTAARLVERPARAAAYGPTARSAIERIERLGVSATSLTLLAPPGADAAAWAAVWHLASPRADRILLVVDGVASSTEPLSFWRDPATSPIEATASGTLVVLDPQALPLEVQSFLGASADRLALAVAVPKTLSALVAEGRMNERLADPLGDRAVAIPPLSARAEDLRGLAQAHLSRLGIQLRGAPLGLEASALAELLEHGWPGNDVELEATLTRAALAARGSAVTRADLRAIGFVATPPRSAGERGSARPQARQR